MNSGVASNATSIEIAPASTTLTISLLSPRVAWSSPAPSQEET
jgi:hypothetical protein